MSLSIRQLSKQLKAGSTTPGNITHFSGNALDLTLVLPTGETFDGAEKVWLEIHTSRTSDPDDVLTDLEVETPTGSEVLLQLTSAHMNLGFDGPLGQFWIVVFVTWAGESPERTEVIWTSNLILQRHNASLTSPARGGAAGLPSTAEIVVVNTSRNLLASDVGKLLTTTANITLTLDETEAIPANSIISLLPTGSGTIAFDVATTEDFEGVATVLKGGQQAELLFEAKYSAFLIRRSVEGTAINPSSIGATTPGTGAFTTVTASGTVRADAFEVSSSDQPSRIEGRSGIFDFKSNGVYIAFLGVNGGSRFTVANDVVIGWSPSNKGLVQVYEIDSAFSRVEAGVLAAGNGTAGDYSGFVQDIYRRKGSGSPESVVTAPVGAVYHRTDGGAGTSFYVKESGTGNTGWVAK